ncbi:hypothetical protein PORY_002595 [Pneumocystis oryctolagi]|uniref:Uncharacterized protein n=1 Tax=Pneumocystis oryctolagi TaxID=42067 RepID=A0ACB7CAI9_9ASCO|nr:hypothetical protein PORY_002595 [Pneumocystis oryctolagi]
MLSRSESNASSPIWDSSDPQRRPPPLPMREELTLNHVDSLGKLSRTQSTSSHLYRQTNTKSPRIADEKIVDMIYNISETIKIISEDLHSLIDRSKDNASSLIDLKKNINATMCDQKIIDEIQTIITSQFQKITEKNECHGFQEELNEILQILNKNISTYNTQTQVLNDMNKRLEAIEIFQDKILSQKAETDHLISSYETSRQANLIEIEDIYRRKIEVTNELARLDTHVSHKRDALNQLEERMKTLEGRLMEIQLKLNKQKDENKKLNKLVTKKRIPSKLFGVSQNIRHFSLSDIHNRNPSVVTLASSPTMDKSLHSIDDFISHEKEKRKISWSKKVANAMGISFQHNKENSIEHLQNNEKSIVRDKRKNYPVSFGIKNTKAFRSFSTRV